MRTILLGLFVAALAVHANAAYHFKQKTLGVCDQNALIVTTTPEPDEYMQFKLATHGLFVAQTAETCTGSSCAVQVEQLFRPELATGENVAKEFAWQPPVAEPAQCASLQVEDGEVPDMYTPIEGDFENRELALFHGIKCFKYFDAGSDDALYGDDATGAFYGMDMEGVRYAYNVTAAKHTPKTFTFNSTEKPECEPDSFKEPPREPYEKACEDLPQRHPVSFVSFSRHLRALTHKLRAHKRF